MGVVDGRFSRFDGDGYFLGAFWAFDATPPMDDTVTPSKGGLKMSHYPTYKAANLQKALAIII
jgi:hypothetical protein